MSRELDREEAEAIALALELEAEQVLIDERRGRRIAARLNLRYTGILGILVEAETLARRFDQSSRILGCCTFIQQCSTDC